MDLCQNTGVDRAELRRRLLESARALTNRSEIATAAMHESLNVLSAETVPIAHENVITLHTLTTDDAYPHHDSVESSDASSTNVEPSIVNSLHAIVTDHHTDYYYARIISESIITPNTTLFKDEIVLVNAVYVDGRVRLRTISRQKRAVIPANAIQPFRYLCWEVVSTIDRLLFLLQDRCTDAPLKVTSDAISSLESLLIMPSNRGRAACRGCQSLPGGRLCKQINTAARGNMDAALLSLRRIWNEGSARNVRPRSHLEDMVEHVLAIIESCDAVCTPHGQPDVLSGSLSPPVYRLYEASERRI